MIRTRAPHITQKRRGRSGVASEFSELVSSKGRGWR
jgi:hypothetical protein